VEKNLKKYLEEKTEQNRMRTGDMQITAVSMPAMIS
jgi:hypothetical protein